MTEDKLNSLRQQDTNLRDAIRLDERERPVSVLRGCDV